LEKPDYLNNPIPFGVYTTDHMLEIDFKGNTWQDPVISKYHDLSINPLNSTLHYAIQLFEGMKAFKTDDGKVTLFRPEMNMKRMNDSAKRLSLPVIYYLINNKLAF
jgi:branched-chain amino acid aminotransferase